MRVLIVDDSVTMRHLLQSVVATLQAETVEAADGRQALKILADQWPFDVALVDWDMPVMNGIEFVKSVRADSRFNGLKIMMVTADNSMEGVGKAINSGADDYLMKPLTGQMVIDKLRVLGLLD